MQTYATITFQNIISSFHRTFCINSQESPNSNRIQFPCFWNSLLANLQHPLSLYIHVIQVLSFPISPISPVIALKIKECLQQMRPSFYITHHLLNQILLQVPSRYTHFQCLDIKKFSKSFGVHSRLAQIPFGALIPTRL